MPIGRALPFSTVKLIPPLRGKAGMGVVCSILLCRMLQAFTPALALPLNMEGINEEGILNLYLFQA
jgi:hypothetical protein